MSLRLAAPLSLSFALSLVLYRKASRVHLFGSWLSGDRAAHQTPPPKKAPKLQGQFHFTWAPPGPGAHAAGPPPEEGRPPRGEAPARQEAPGKLRGRTQSTERQNHEHVANAACLSRVSWPKLIVALRCLFSVSCLAGVVVPVFIFQLPERALAPWQCTTSLPSVA